MLYIVLSFLLGASLTAVIAWRLALRLARSYHKKQRKLLERTRRAERRAELGELTGGLAHELKNPLSTVKINLQLLHEDISNLAKTAPPPQGAPQAIDSPHRRYQRQLRKIETITAEAQRLNDTLNDFLRLAGGLELNLTPCDLNKLIDDLADFYEPQALSKNINVRLSLTPKPAPCQLDIDLIKQALLNLFLNATQAMPEGGELMIRTAVHDQTVQLDIIDTGPGIEPEKQRQIFTPYFTTKPGGSGLGLPMCRRIIEEHQGHLDLHSEPPKGSNFRITLPLTEK